MVTAPWRILVVFVLVVVAVFALTLVSEAEHENYPNLNACAGYTISQNASNGTPLGSDASDMVEVCQEEHGVPGR